MKKITIAIDGGSGTGKWTTAMWVAKLLWYAFVDTGAMYRAATLWMLQEGVIRAHEELLAARREEIDITFWSGTQEWLVFLGGIDVTDAIRSPEVNDHVARISSFLTLRTYLRKQQRALARKGGVVMDGRDMGSVVVPDAEVKVFLSCSFEERARRRHAEMGAKWIEIPLEIVQKNLEERDVIDYTGDHPTSRKAPDAKELDTTNITIDQQIAIVVGWAKEAIQQPKKQWKT